MSNISIQLTYQHNVNFLDLDFLTLEDGTERLSGNDYELLKRRLHNIPAERRSE
jgi:hypothetical protein